MNKFLVLLILLSCSVVLTIENFGFFPPQEQFKEEFLKCMASQGGITSIYGEITWSVVQSVVQFTHEEDRFARNSDRFGFVVGLACDVYFKVAYQISLEYAIHAAKQCSTEVEACIKASFEETPKIKRFCVDLSHIGEGTLCINM